MPDLNYWTARAEAYDRLSWARDPDLLRWTADRMLASAWPKRACSAVDIGCGTGHLTGALRAAGCPTIGIDTSEAMIERAKARWADRPGIEFRVGDATEVFGDLRFDLIAARMVLHHTASPSEALARWIGLVRPGGVIAVAEGVPHAGHDAQVFFGDVFAVKEPGRWTLTAASIAQHMLDLGCVDVAAHERFTEDNSLRNWLDGNALHPDTRATLETMHFAACQTPGFARAYRWRQMPDGDILMRWRHCVVVGRVLGELTVTMLSGTVLCLGDSLTFGARSPLGYPEHLGPLLTSRAEGVEWACVNRGVSGETTRQIFDRAPGAVAQVAAMPGPRWAVVLAGTNDAKGGGLPIAQWEALYRQVLHWIRRAGIPIAVCTFPPVHPGRMPAFTSQSRTWLREASVRVRAIAVEPDCQPSPVRCIELEDMPETVLCDGVHMTPDGYRLMAERIAAALLPVEVSEMVSDSFRRSRQREDG